VHARGFELGPVAGAETEPAATTAAAATEIASGTEIAPRTELGSVLTIAGMSAIVAPAGSVRSVVSVAAALGRVVLVGFEWELHGDLSSCRGTAGPPARRR
jgi:hypothetical protein